MATVLFTSLNVCAIEFTKEQKQELDSLSSSIAELTSAYLSLSLPLRNETSLPRIKTEKSNPQYLSDLSHWVSEAQDKQNALQKNQQSTFEKHNNAYIIAAEVHQALPDIRLDIDSKHTSIFVEALLNANDIKTVKKLSEEVFENASYLTSTVVRFQLASYYFNIGDTQNTLDYLLSIDTQEALSKDEQDYATLMLGVTLQKQKKHREALKIYKKIGPDSNYFTYSQLNKALAFVLQGWWTDAELAIEEGFKQAKKISRKTSTLNENEIDLENRTLLFLAYSQLKYEYYRNARNSLRKISLDSPYVNKALLAMGLAALNQKDFLGAINAFTRLKSAKTDELSKTEAYLMAAFTYESMGDLNEAEKLYTEALAFFAKETLYWQKKILDSRSQPLLLEQAQKYAFNSAIKKQMFFLNSVDQSTIPAPNQQQYSETKLRFNNIINAALVKHYQQKIQYIESYQSQSQYALARLYDANQ